MKDVDITDQGWDSSNNDIIGRRGRGRSWGREGWGVPVGEQAYQPRRNSEGFQKAQRICIISCVYWIFPFSYFGFWWQISPDSQWKTYMTHTHTHTYLHTLTHTKEACFLQQKIQYRSFKKERKKVYPRHQWRANGGLCLQLLPDLNNVSNCAQIFCLQSEVKDLNINSTHFSSSSSKTK